MIIESLKNIFIGLNKILFQLLDGWFGYFGPINTVLLEFLLPGFLIFLWFRLSRFLAYRIYIHRSNGFYYSQGKLTYGIGNFVLKKNIEYFFIPMLILEYLILLSPILLIIFFVMFFGVSGFATANGKIVDKIIFEFNGRNTIFGKFSSSGNFDEIFFTIFQELLKTTTGQSDPALSKLNYSKGDRNLRKSNLDKFLKERLDQFFYVSPLKRASKKYYPLKTDPMQNRQLEESKLDKYYQQKELRWFDELFFNKRKTYRNFPRRDFENLVRATVKDNSINVYGIKPNFLSKVATLSEKKWFWSPWTIEIWSQVDYVTPFRNVPWSNAKPYTNMTEKKLVKELETHLNGDLGPPKMAMVQGALDRRFFIDNLDNKYVSDAFKLSRHKKKKIKYLRNAYKGTQPFTFLFGKLRRKIYQEKKINEKFGGKYLSYFPGLNFFGPSATDHNSTAWHPYVWQSYGNSRVNRNLRPRQMFLDNDYMDRTYSSYYGDVLLKNTFSDAYEAPYHIPSIDYWDQQEFHTGTLKKLGLLQKIYEPTAYKNLLPSMENNAVGVGHYLDIPMKPHTIGKPIKLTLRDDIDKKFENKHWVYIGWKWDTGKKKFVRAEKSMHTLSPRYKFRELVFNLYEKARLFPRSMTFRGEDNQTYRGEKVTDARWRTLHSQKIETAKEPIFYGFLDNKSLRYYHRRHLRRWNRLRTDGPRSDMLGYSIWKYLVYEAIPKFYDLRWKSKSRVDRRKIFRWVKRRVTAMETFNPWDEKGTEEQLKRVDFDIIMRKQSEWLDVARKYGNQQKEHLGRYMFESKQTPKAYGTDPVSLFQHWSRYQRFRWKKYYPLYFKNFRTEYYDLWFFLDSQRNFLKNNPIGNGLDSKKNTTFLEMPANFFLGGLSKYVHAGSSTGSLMRLFFSNYSMNFLGTRGDGLGISLEKQWEHVQKNTSYSILKKLPTDRKFSYGEKIQNFYENETVNYYNKNMWLFRENPCHDPLGGKFLGNAGLWTTTSKAPGPLDFKRRIEYGSFSPYWNQWHREQFRPVIFQEKYRRALYPSYYSIFGKYSRDHKRRIYPDILELRTARELAERHAKLGSNYLNRQHYLPIPGPFRRESIVRDHRLESHIPQGAPILKKYRTGSQWFFVQSMDSMVRIGYLVGIVGVQDNDLDVGQKNLTKSFGDMFISLFRNIFDLREGWKRKGKFYPRGSKNFNSKNALRKAFLRAKKDREWVLGAIQRYERKTGANNPRAIFMRHRKRRTLRLLLARFRRKARRIFFSYDRITSPKKGMLGELVDEDNYKLYDLGMDGKQPKPLNSEIENLAMASLLKKNYLEKFFSYDRYRLRELEPRKSSWHKYGKYVAPRVHGIAANHLTARDFINFLDSMKYGLFGHNIELFYLGRDIDYLYRKSRGEKFLVVKNFLENLKFSTMEISRNENSIILKLFSQSLELVPLPKILRAWLIGLFIGLAEMVEKLIRWEFFVFLVIYYILKHLIFLKAYTKYDPNEK